MAFYLFSYIFIQNSNSNDLGRLCWDKKCYERKISKNGNAYNLLESFPGRHLNATSRKSLENAPLSQNEGQFRNEHLYK